MQQTSRKPAGKKEGRPPYRGSRPQGGRMDRDPRKRRRKPCLFCMQKIPVDYKDNDIMRKFVTERGKIMTQRSSGCCAKHQRALAVQIKRARQIGLLAYTAE
jgi:small subunit ribosomal protein S18